MTRLKSWISLIFRAGLGAMAGVLLLAACAKAPPPAAAGGDQPATVGQSFNTDFDALYDELAGA